MSNMERAHIINALATYICVTAKRKSQFTNEVDTTDIGAMLDANHTEQEKAHLEARKILRDFL